MLKACLSTLQGFLFPASCVLCGKPGDDGRELCAECLVDLPYNPHACQRCAIPLPGPFALCGQCQTTTPPYDAAISIFRYDYPLDHLIQRLKFNAKLHLATLLGELMAEHLHHAAGTLPELLIPVPLHTARLRERGFNQALELARPIARALQRPLDYRSCVRLRATQAQSLLPAKEKRANVKNAFGVVRPIEARHVAIIDDVMTTGHTVQELAGIVRKAGVERIDVWVLARAARKV
jgi:ComF family protein